VSPDSVFGVEEARFRCGRPLSIDADSRRGGLTARRNVLFGLWAARRLRLPPGEREAYAWSVHFADFEAPGDDDVIAKVADDFAMAGIPASKRQLRHYLREMLLRAYFQLSVSTSRARPVARPPRRRS
jgi:hypothetical protein